MSDSVNLRCAECGSVVEDSPMMMERCINCGGDLERVDGPVSPPEAPSDLPKYLGEGVEKQSPERLRDLIEYADQMADWKEAQADRELEEQAEKEDVDTTPDEWEQQEWKEVVDDARDEADIKPGKGTLTTKNIDDRDYYYLQWREESKIKSQYVAPVNPSGKDQG